MTRTSAIRSFAITWTITFAIIGSNVSGFTIDRTTNNTSSTQIEGIDSSLNNTFYQPKEDLRRQNDTVNSNDDDSNKTNAKSLETMVTDIIPSVTTVQTLSVQQKQTSTDVGITTENNKIPTISSDTVEVFDSVEDVTEFKKSANESSFQLNELKPEEYVIALAKNSKSSESSATTPFNEVSTATDRIATDSESTSDHALKTIKTSYQNYDNVSPINSLPEMNTETSTLTTVSITKSEDIIADINHITDFPSTVSESILLASNDKSSINNTPAIVPESSITDAMSNLNSETTEPSWKKYTTIVRKRVTSAEDQTFKTEDETMNAETSNSHFNFEKNDVSSYSPSEKLSDDWNKNAQMTDSETMAEESGKQTMAVKTTTLSQNTVENTEIKTRTMFQTKRAGFLDHSTKVSTIITSNEQNSNEKLKAIDDTVTEASDLNKVTSSESQSLLAEDAIQEELMKEEALNNQHENLNRHADNKKVKLLEDTTITEATPTMSAEESLSVRPINHERSRTTLYTISPNYKPMKKIDVQPAKQFVRDPDDNSWRNESISSLGIVFKPKNSSISFKEVLKNKTQTELSNLQDKDTKDHLPDLRVRLEKIAEVRKTKKKKMKNGEEVYVDYEEDKSVESTSTSIPETVTTTHIVHPSSSTASNNQNDMTTLTLEANKVKTSQALFKSLGLDSLDYLTTAKPKKKFNVAEYYDTTDEYDADYVTMSKLDLKKFTVPPVKTSPPKEMSHIEPLLNIPMSTQFPERKPTVQYFPPRKVEKVNVNNVDKDFERRINLYKNVRHKIEPELPFVTVAPLTIATEQTSPRPDMPPDIKTHLKPDMRPNQLVNPPLAMPNIIPNMRPTVKPTDFTPPDMGRNYYLTNAPRTTEAHDAYVIHEGSLNRGSYVIKHYKDLLNAVVLKNSEDERTDYVPLTESPHQAHTPAAVAHIGSDVPKGVDYDYDTQIRKDVINRFVDNFNQNSERFKVDFPILYNNSIVHRPADEHGRVMASSRDFLKRLYEGTATKSNMPRKSCEPHCDMTVELSPAYELHYYVPEQEEKEEIQGRSATPPQATYRYTL